MTAETAISCPDPTPSQLPRACIDAQTAMRGHAASRRPIFLRPSPHVPNLSLVDLPGLTMTALTAQGQPADIKQQIRSMVGSHFTGAHDHPTRLPGACGPGVDPALSSRVSTIRRASGPSACSQRPI